MIYKLHIWLYDNRPSFSFSNSEAAVLPFPLLLRFPCPPSALSCIPPSTLAGGTYIAPSPLRFSQGRSAPTNLFA